MTISGIINWEKINDHKARYIASGGTDWKEEFKRFTADRGNYRDTIILLSSGLYSAVPAKWVHMDEKDWQERSVTIRMYHELTHFICRKLFPEKKDALRDEIYADCIGLIAAFGRYNASLAKIFLGIENEITCRAGGRLEHYVPECTEEVVRDTARLIQEAKARVDGNWRPDGWESLPEQEKDARVFDLVLKIY